MSSGESSRYPVEHTSRFPAGNVLLLLTLLFIALNVSVPVRALAEDRELADLFARTRVRGTMVISSLDGRITYTHDSRRAHHRYPVASTFKILNTLIALQEGAARGKDEKIRWDGHQYDFPDWNHDQTLESAFKASCVWYYQELARRLGAETYREYLRRCSFGELEEPFEATTFWLDGSLRASACEQVEFLRRVCKRTLPFSATAYETLAGIMVVEKASGGVIRAKSGWAVRGAQQQGWYVGWVDSGQGGIWLFAMNMDLLGPDELPLRQRITREALQVKGIID